MSLKATNNGERNISCIRVRNGIHIALNNKQRLKLMIGKRKTSFTFNCSYVAFKKETGKRGKLVDQFVLVEGGKEFNMQEQAQPARRSSSTQLSLRLTVNHESESNCKPIHFYHQSFVLKYMIVTA